MEYLNQNKLHGIMTLHAGVASRHWNAGYRVPPRLCSAEPTKAACLSLHLQWQPFRQSIEEINKGKAAVPLCSAFWADWLTDRGDIFILSPSLWVCLANLSSWGSERDGQNNKTTKGNTHFRGVVLRRWCVSDTCLSMCCIYLSDCMFCESPPPMVSVDR